jgi:hypothetical protein
MGRNRTSATGQKRSFNRSMLIAKLCLSRLTRLTDAAVGPERKAQIWRLAVSISSIL